MVKPPQTISDAIQDLSNGLAQLVAMAAMSYGEAGESLRQMNDSLQDNFMWALHDKAVDCHQLVEVILNASESKNHLIGGEHGN